MPGHSVHSTGMDVYARDALRSGFIKFLHLTREDGYFDGYQKKMLMGLCRFVRVVLSESQRCGRQSSRGRIAYLIEEETKKPAG